MKKNLALILIFGMLFSRAFAQSELENAPEQDSPTFKDVAISVGDAFLINMIFNSAGRIILQEEYAETNLSTMKENLKSHWVWDEDGFFMNQAGHPYQGALYFTAGRSNGLNFWQSAIIAATASFLWEEFGETTTPAINDFITTPICGAIVGESLHRVFIDANELCPALAWILSPLDAFNSLYRNKKLSVSGRTEEIDLIFHGGIEQSQVSFSSDLDADSLKKFGVGQAIHIQYGIEDAHSTKEPFDLFTADLDSIFSRNFYDIDFCIDGFLWSQGLYFDESDGTLGINLMYEGKRSSNTVFSNAAVGFKYIGTKSLSESDEDGKFKFSAQIDGVFMGTRSLYYLYEDYKIDIHNSNPVRSYNFAYGALAKASISIGTSRLGTFSAEGEVSFLIPYPYSELEAAESTKHFMTSAKIGYEHNITNFFSLGLKDYFIYKVDWFKNAPDTTQILNSVQLYGKVIFKRK